MEKLKAILPILAPLVTASLGAFGILFQEWRQKRDQRYRRNQARAEATEMVTFVEKWIQTQQLICSPEQLDEVRQTARTQLEQVYSALSKRARSKAPRTPA